jgi:hypothetical protein
MTAIVPVQAEFDALTARVSALEAAPAPTPTVDVGAVVYRPEDYRLAGDPAADWTLAFQRMFNALQDALVADAGGSVPVVAGVVELGARSYPVTGSIIPSRSGRAEGLTVRGVGKRTTEIVYTGTGDLLDNTDRWMNVRWYDLSFRGVGSGTFLRSTSTGAAQDWNFVNVEWRGSWTDGIVLDGPSTSNTNSEWVFERCTVTAAFTGSFLHSGASPQYAQQDQFLNFWFWGCKIEFAGGTFLKFERGGSISVRDSSLIATGTGQTFFSFPKPPTAHADSVQNLIIDGCRIEPRDVSNVIMNSFWKGQITVRGVMDNAWAYRTGNDDVALWHFTDPGGVTFEGCQLAGVHRYTQDTAPSVQSIRYVSCQRTETTHRNASFYVKDGSSAAAVKILISDDRDGLTGA